MVRVESDGQRESIAEEQDRKAAVGQAESAISSKLQQAATQLIARSPEKDRAKPWIIYSLHRHR